ncbi:MAG: D-2-hydroxyacid dehydrogenase [Bacteroidetes bacterium]|nr:D-2-hydroxyacid dehydrogenase [Bacteroidota bacterium]MCL5026811.1 D-2-hydroxyacid dehydrogenase [Chloroflexota bacterium]
MSISKVKVLVTQQLSPALLSQIAAVDPRVELVYAFDAFRHDFLKAGGRPVEETPEILARQQKYEDDLGSAEVAFVFGVPPNLQARGRSLKWVMLASAGFDHARPSGILDGTVNVTNAPGVAAIPISERVMEMMLSLAKQTPLLFQQKQEKAWRRVPAIELYGATVGLISLGHIGTEVAKRAKPFGMRVIATRRTAAAGETAPNVDQIFPLTQLRDLIAESDFVVLCLPLTKESKGLLGEAELRAMKKSAYLINVARAEIVDDDALQQALREGWFAGAGLDVFPKEPLPPESPYWELPNVLVSPHIAGQSPRTDGRMVALFCTNLRRYLYGQPLENVINTQRGY